MKIPWSAVWWLVIVWVIVRVSFELLLHSLGLGPFDFGGVYSSTVGFLVGALVMRGRANDRHTGGEPCQ
jgi:hypothetical protein